METPISNHCQTSPLHVYLEVSPSSSVATSSVSSETSGDGEGEGGDVTLFKAHRFGVWVLCWFSVQQTSISNFSFENFYISASQKFTSKKRTKLKLTSAWKKYFVHSGIEHFNERQHFLYTSASERQIV